MRYILLIPILLIARPALAQDEPPPSDAPPPPPIREPLPPKVQDPDEQIQPQVVIRREEDRIVEEGTHRELLARNGLYARLWRLQALENGKAPVSVMTEPGTAKGFGPK